MQGVYGPRWETPPPPQPAQYAGMLAGPTLCSVGDQDSAHTSCCSAGAPYHSHCEEAAIWLLTMGSIFLKKEPFRFCHNAVTQRRTSKANYCPWQHMSTWPDKCSSLQCISLNVSFSDASLLTNACHCVNWHYISTFHTNIVQQYCLVALVLYICTTEQCLPVQICYSAKWNMNPIRLIFLWIDGKLSPVPLMCCTMCWYVFWCSENAAWFIWIGHLVVGY